MLPGFCVPLIWSNTVGAACVECSADVNARAKSLWCGGCAQLTRLACFGAKSGQLLGRIRNLNLTCWHGNKCGVNRATYEQLSEELQDRVTGGERLVGVIVNFLGEAHLNGKHVALSVRVSPDQARVERKPVLQHSVKVLSERSVASVASIASSQTLGDLRQRRRRYRRPTFIPPPSHPLTIPS